jgi:AbrB family looped-hinge helix DNA binding protein
MKIGNIVKPNEKGQLVIPKEIRDTLGITSQTSLHIVFRGDGFYIYPIREIISEGGQENVYSKILETTRGAWLAGTGKRAAGKRTVELAASARRKRRW